MNRSYLSELLNIVLLAVVLYLIFTRGCGKGGEVEYRTDTLTTVSYVHDTVWHQLPQKVIHTPAEIVYKEIPRNIDTVFIIKKYAASYFYDETISDSSIDINIKDTVSMNEITWRDVKYLWKKPVTVIENKITQVTPAKTKLWAGFNIGGNKNELSSFTPEIELTFPEGRAFSVGYNLQNKSAEVGVKWRVGK
jgi:hypothetical protein